MRAKEFIFEQAEEFTTAYHVTTEENAEEIVLAGLRPSDGFVYLIVDEGDQRKLAKEIDQVANWIYARTEGSDDELTLLKINVRGLPLKYEYGWYKSLVPIGADRIKDLGPDTLARYV